MKKMFIAILLFSCSANLFRQTKVGSSIVPFLNIRIGPKAVALGGAFLATVNDASTLYWNLAAISCNYNSRAMFAHSSWFADIVINWVGAYVNLGNMGSVGLRLNYAYDMTDIFSISWWALKAVSNEKPVHSVYVSSFYMDKHEVTQREYEKVMGVNPSYFKDPDKPVERVNWDDAVTYARKVGKRLPTEAEWEYAAKGGNRSRGYTFSGSNNINVVAWHDGNSGSSTHGVGKKIPNELGIYDMSGNVWEWCNDWLDYEYYSRSERNNPTGPNLGEFRL